MGLERLANPYSLCPLLSVVESNNDYYKLYSLTVFSLAKLILEISPAYRLEIKSLIKTTLK